MGRSHVALVLSGSTQAVYALECDGVGGSRAARSSPDNKCMSRARALELLVHTEDTRLLAAVQWMMIPVSIDEQLIEIAKHLPEDWRQLPAPPSTREFGTQWVMQAR